MAQYRRRALQENWSWNASFNGVSVFAGCGYGSVAQEARPSRQLIWRFWMSEVIARPKAVRPRDCLRIIAAKLLKATRHIADYLPQHVSRLGLTQRTHGVGQPLCRSASARHQRPVARHAENRGIGVNMLTFCFKQLPATPS